MARRTIVVAAMVVVWAVAAGVAVVVLTGRDRDTGSVDAAPAKAEAKQAADPESTVPHAEHDAAEHDAAEHDAAESSTPGVESESPAVDDSTSAESGSAGASPQPQPPSATEFVADFTSPDDLYLFDWQVFHGGIDPTERSDQPSQWHGDHDMDCGAPVTLRPVQLIGETEPGPPETAGDLIWWCGSRPDAPASSGHVMTSTSLVAYGHIDFSPRQVFDNVSRVCWDQNWTEMGGRKWTQVVVVSEDVFQANDGRMEYVEIGLQDDVAVNGLPVTGDTWMLNLKRASTRVQVGQDETYINDYGFVTDDKSRRFKHCAIDQGNGTVRLELERLDGTEIREAPGSFPAGPARVIFQDVTYDSVKGDLSMDEAQQTNTWHWDNIEIS